MRNPVFHIQTQIRSMNPFLLSGFLMSMQALWLQTVVPVSNFMDMGQQLSLFVLSQVEFVQLSRFHISLPKRQRVSDFLYYMLLDRGHEN